MKPTKLLVAATTAALALALGLQAAVARPDAAPPAVPGVAPARIVVGGTAPLAPGSGAAAVVRGAQAYLAHVNARGGVHGRAIVYRAVDDGGDPARARAAARLLVDEPVFALFNTVGTEQSLAVRAVAHARGVPQLFAASGSVSLGREASRFPWTIGFAPSHESEGWVHGTYLARARPGARIAVLLGDGEDARELLGGLRRVLAGSRVRIVATQAGGAAAADPAAAAVAALRASKADVLAVLAPAEVAATALAAASSLAWAPLVLLDGDAARAARPPENAFSTTYLKHPADPRWADDPGVALARGVLRRHARGAGALDVLHLQGMAAAHELVRVLRAAGAAPTRAKAMAAARRLNDPGNPFLLPGIVVRTRAGDASPIEHLALQRRRGGRWQVVGGLWGPVGAR